MGAFIKKYATACENILLAGGASKSTSVELLTIWYVIILKGVCTNKEHVGGSDDDECQ